MEKLWTYFLSVSWILLAVSCTQEEHWYKKEFSETEQQQLAGQLLAAWSNVYYQGTVPDQLLLAESMLYDSTRADTWRAVGTAYLKRGLAKEFYTYYEKASAMNPVEWRGWTGYMYLYLYRDYERAVASFNATDTLTPNFTDYPQGQSVDYMRGIAYYGLKDYRNALFYLTKYITEVTQEEGEEWVDTYAFLYRALVYEKVDEPDSALLDVAALLQHNPTLSDAYYHQSRIYHGKGNDQKATELLAKAQDLFQRGYFHQRPYVEVLEQIYQWDIDQLKKQIKEPG